MDSSGLQTFRLKVREEAYVRDVSFLIAHSKDRCTEWEGDNTEIIVGMGMLVAVSVIDLENSDWNLSVVNFLSRRSS